MYVLCDAAHDDKFIALFVANIIIVFMFSILYLIRP